MAELRWIIDGWSHSISPIDERSAKDKAMRLFRQKGCEMVQVRRGSYTVLFKQKRINRINRIIRGIHKPCDAFAERRIVNEPVSEPCKELVGDRILILNSCEKVIDRNLEEIGKL